MDSLVYHDLYMLVDLIGTGLATHSVRVLARHSGYWNFTCVYGDTTVCFEYTLSKSTVTRKTLEVIPTSNEINSKTVEFRSLQPSITLVHIHMLTNRYLHTLFIPVNTQ